MNLLALDVGEARIGLAVASSGTSFVFGRGYLKRQSLQEDIRALKQLMHAERTDQLVIGLPLKQDGSYSKQTQRVRSFARALQAEGMDIEFEDERYTSKVASQHMLASGLGKKRRQEKGRRDEASAILILESYLARRAQSLENRSEEEGSRG